MYFYLDNLNQKKNLKYISQKLTQNFTKTRKMPFQFTNSINNLTRILITYFINLNLLWSNKYLFLQ